MLAQQVLPRPIVTLPGPLEQFLGLNLLAVLSLSISRRQSMALLREPLSP
jgi:hypothetical protein